MNSSSPDRTLGELLRSLREAQNLDVSAVARQVNLSAAQVLQLESGDLLPNEKSLFYTAAIKEKAARKLLQALGGDPQTLWSAQVQPLGQINKSKDLPDLQILDDLASLLKKQSQAQEMGRNDRRFSWKWGVLVFVALWLAGAIGYYGQSVLTWIQAHKPMALMPVSASTATPSPQASAEEAPQVMLPQMPALQSPAPIMETVLAPAEALCSSTASQTTLMPSQPSKAGSSVHVVALAELVMCIRDGAGKQTALTLKAQESRTFWGRAPWSLRIQKPVPMHMFFQGQKIYWPEGEPSGVVLKEVAGDY